MPKYISTPTAKQQRAQRHPITFLEDVTYKRSTGAMVRGWVSDASVTILYIFDTATGLTVAAPRNRVRRAVA